MAYRQIVNSSGSLLERLASSSLACSSSPSSSILSACTSWTAQQVRGLAAPAKTSKDTGIKKMKKASGQDDVDTSNPRLKPLITLLSSPERKDTPPSPEEQALEQAYRKDVHEEHLQWAADMETKFRLQQEALAALPERLRALAMRPDHTPFPMNRKFLFDTPPEVYRDGSEAHAAKR